MAHTKTLSIVQWSHFVPEYDKWFDNFAKDWGSKNKIAVTVDHIPVANVAARAAAEASAQSGHDLFGWNGSGGAHLYRKFLVDVTSLVEETREEIRQGQHDRPADRLQSGRQDLVGISRISTSTSPPCTARACGMRSG